MRYFSLPVTLTYVLCLASFAHAEVDPSPRPAALAAQLTDGPLKQQLQSCETGPFKATSFSIAHRGAPLGYPEHTEQGYRAAAQMGAGVIECDVTFTKDLALVCRHSQCDLHSTTNILQTPLARQCRAPFAPAKGDQPATAQCCTSDITLDEFRTLCGRRDHINSGAKTIDEYLVEPDNVVLDEPLTCGTLMTHAESIALFDALGVEMTPELKSPMVDMPFNGMDQAGYADRLIAEYAAAQINPDRVHPQSFSLKDVAHWINKHPQFGRQAVYLDPRGGLEGFTPSLADMQRLKSMGVNTVAPPIPMLLAVTADGSLVPSDYARYARQAGLEIITWTFESGTTTEADHWIYSALPGVIAEPGDMLKVLDALAQQVGVKGVFSDWPGTVTYYASCLSPPDP